MATALEKSRKESIQRAELRSRLAERPKEKAAMAKAGEREWAREQAEVNKKKVDVGNILKKAREGKFGAIESKFNNLKDGDNVPYIQKTPNNLSEEKPDTLKIIATNIFVVCDKLYKVYETVSIDKENEDYKTFKESVKKLKKKKDYWIIISGKGGVPWWLVSRNNRRSISLLLKELAAIERSINDIITKIRDQKRAAAQVS